MKKWFYRGVMLESTGAFSPAMLSGKNVKIFRDRHFLWVSIDGFHAKLELKNMSGPSALTKDVRSPMTAKVVEVKVKPGQVVKSGDALVVLSAMKMEYVVKAEQDQVVAKVGCTKDALVNQDDILITYEA